MEILSENTPNQPPIEMRVLIIVFTALLSCGRNDYKNEIIELANEQEKQSIIEEQENKDIIKIDDSKKEVIYFKQNRTIQIKSQKNEIIYCIRIDENGNLFKTYSIDSNFRLTGHMYDYWDDGSLKAYNYFRPTIAENVDNIQESICYLKINKLGSVEGHSGALTFYEGYKEYLESFSLNFVLPKLSQLYCEVEIQEFDSTMTTLYNEATYLNPKEPFTYDMVNKSNVVNVQTNCWDMIGGDTLSTNENYLMYKIKN